jgi:iron-sulfur cluster insertion protein
MIENTQHAKEHIKTFRKEHAEEVKGKDFRIFVEGGGCSGFQYGFTFDPPQENDERITLEKGLVILIDPLSLQFLEGITLDYVDDFRGAGFLVKNPHASSTCSCGMSFSV